MDTGAPDGTDPANYPDPNIEVSITNAKDSDLLDRPGDNAAATNGKSKNITDSAPAGDDQDSGAPPGTDPSNYPPKDLDVSILSKADADVIDRPDQHVDDAAAAGESDAQAPGGDAAASAVSDVSARGLDLPTADSMPTADTASEKVPAAESALQSAAAPAGGGDASGIMPSVTGGADTSLEAAGQAAASRALESGGTAPAEDVASPEAPSISDGAGCAFATTTSRNAKLHNVSCYADEARNLGVKVRAALM